MGPVQQRPGAGEPRALGWLVALDLTAKALLLLLVLQVALDPTWGNLEGKAPGARAVTYPLLAFLVPVVFHLRRSRGSYPWGADVLLTVPAFSDMLGNRLDLYDRVDWFDDLVHLANTGFLAAAVVLLCGAAHSPLRRRLELAVASGMSLSLLWELWELFAFVQRSAEAGNAYVDTVGDLALGWVGAVAAAVLVGAEHRPIDAAWTQDDVVAGQLTPVTREDDSTEGV